LAPRINPAHHATLLVLSAIALGLATIAAIVALMPWLKIGPATTSLAGWMSGGGTTTTSKVLYDSKAIILGSNQNRLLVMRVFFAIQAIATGLAVGLALSYIALG
jgi:hypothetical protein